MLIRYTGNKFPKVVELPVPFVSMSEKTGEIVFSSPENNVQEFDNESGNNLAELGGFLEKAMDVATDVKKVEPVVVDEHIQEDSVQAFNDMAESLLMTTGLNHSSFTRAMGFDSKKMNDKAKTKIDYDKVISFYKDNIEKRGHDFFFKKSSLPENVAK